MYMIQYTISLQSSFINKVSSLIVRDGLDENTNIGALVNQEAVNKVNAQIEEPKVKVLPF